MSPKTVTFQTSDTAIFQYIILVIDLLVILLKSLNRALFLYSFIQDVRSSGVRASITIVRIRKFDKMHQNIVRFRFFLTIAKRSICRQDDVII